MNDLTSKLIKEFASVTNDAVEKHEGAVVYGEISIVNEDTFIKIDGSDILTPCTTTVKVKSGHRVIATVKDHKVTVTSNITDPSAYGIIVDEMGIRMKGVVTIENLQNGVTVIDGDWIKTGKIDAQYLNLTGAITFGDLSVDTQAKINNAAPISQFSVDGQSNWHSVMTSADYYRRESTDGGKTWGEAYQFRGKNGQNGSDGSDANVPSYIKNTYIDSTTIKSPTIEAAIFNVFPETEDSTSGSYNIYGNYNGTQFHFLTMKYEVTDFPYIHICSPDDAYMYLADGNVLNVNSLYTSFNTETIFRSTVDFSNATVIGLEGAGTGDGYAKFK